MNIHKRTRLTLLDRQEIWRLYQTRSWKVTHLAERFWVSRATVYNVLKRARLREFTPRDSTNQRFKTIQYGLKRLAKVEQAIQGRLKRQARRHNKSYPGEPAHFDTKRLPLLKGQSPTQPRECLLVAIDDFSRERYADSLPDKTQDSAASFLADNVTAPCPYQLDYAHSDNGKEYRGTDRHAFVKACAQHGIGQKSTRVNRPQTNGKAERVICTLMDMGHRQQVFKDGRHRHVELMRFINSDNTAKPHKGLDNATPYEILTAYFNQPIYKQP